MITRSKKKTLTIPKKGFSYEKSYSRVTTPAPSSGIELEKSAVEKRLGSLPVDGKPSFVNWFRELVSKMPQKQISPYTQTFWMPGLSCFKMKTDKHKFYTLHELISVLFPNAKSINLMNLVANSRSP